VWKQELCTDPGGAPTTHMRPDGVLQAVCRDAKGWGDESPTMARVLERSLDGAWTQVLAGFGYLGRDQEFPLDTWESGWGWAAISTIRGTDELLVARVDGYDFLPQGKYKGRLIWSGTKAWPASGGSYHYLPNFIYSPESGYRPCASLHGGDYSAYVRQDLPALHGELLRSIAGGYLMNPGEGYISYLGLGLDDPSGRYQMILYTLPPGQDLFRAGW